MSTLQQIAQAKPEWDLDAFVEAANDVLPQFLPVAKEAGDRPPEAVNPRLVRYYTTQGVVDRPLRQGREARYIYRHLLQLLLVRRLLAEGYSTNAIQPITTEKENAALEALLQGGLQLTVEAANPALAFLQSVQARSAPPAAAPQPPMASLPPPASPVPPVPRVVGESPFMSSPENRALPEDSDVSQWQRVEVLPGLEVQVRSDFVPPSTPQEHENLLQLIAHKLKPLFQAKRSSP